ncbi:MAG: hypothetical protein FJX54_20260 [Alphaproteobacteria bacterium]|nr:hypothetical protein [Alphaproteobacteria bacterium]
MGWFGDRRETVLEALTLKRALAIPLLIAAVTLIVRIAPHVAPGSDLMLWGVPDWAWGVIAGLALLLYFLLEYANRMRLRLVPRLVLTFDADQGGVVETPEKIRDGMGATIEEYKAAYVRIHANSATQRTIRNAVAFLTRIEFKPKGEPTFRITRLSYALSLGQFDIHAGISRHIDFVKSNDKDNTLNFTVPWPLTLREAFKFPGTYRFTIVVSAEDVSSSIEVDIVWTGKWDEMVAHQVRA